MIHLSVPVGQVTEACCPITLQGWPSLSTLCLLRRQKVRGGEGAGRRGQSEPQEDMGQDGAQHTGLAEFGNKSVSTEREGVAKMTSQLRKGLDWGRLWVKGAPRRQGGSPGRGPAGSRR